MDEIQDLLSHKRILFILNSNLEGVKLLGMTATIDRHTKYQIQGEELTKIELLNRFCKVVYSYTYNNASQDKNTKQLRFFILNHELDKRKNLLAGTTASKWMSSEQLQYEFLDRQFKKMLFVPMSDNNRDFKIRMAASNRARFLYGLKSKTEVCKELLKHLPQKTIVFGQDNKQLLELCSTSIIQDNPNLKQDLEDFKKGKTLLTCSNKILRQGENIPDLHNTIFLSYVSKWPAFSQILGRQRKAETTGNIIIFITKNTQEQVWFNSMTSEIEADFIYCDSLQTLIKKL